jgi:hypothetical protein
MHMKSGIHSQCDCECEEICESATVESNACIGSSTTYVGPIVLWESIVCPSYELLEWHVRDYLLGDYENCGVENLTICLVECRNPTLAKCGGEAQHFQSWELGVLRDSRMFRVQQKGPKHLALGCF